MDNQKERIIKNLGVTPEEADEILRTDKEIERGKAQFDFDLSPDQQKVAKTYTRTGTRTVYNFNTAHRERKPNVTKSSFVSMIADFLKAQTDMSVADIAITNKERQIAFSSGGEKFELTLVQKRKPKGVAGS